MAHIKSSAAVIRHWVKLVGKKAGRGGSSAGEESAWVAAGTCIAVRVVQGIKAEQGEPTSGIDAHVGNQLVLAENSAGGVLINVLVGAVRSRPPSDKRRVDVID